MPLVREADASTDAHPSHDPADAVLTPKKAQVVALTLPRASAAALRRASTPSSSADRRLSRSRCSSVTSPLQRVEYVEVQARVRRGGHSRYVVDVYLQRRSGRQRLSDVAYAAPDTSSFSKQAMDALQRAERESDYRVEHRFADFVALRAGLTALVRHDARAGSGGDGCAECRALARLGARAKYKALPLRRVLMTERARRALLTDFVNDALATAARFSELIEEQGNDNGLDEGASEEDGERCASRAQAVELVDAFLRKPFESSLGII